MITAETVKTLRDKTGAGMMDCKRALTEAGGDMEKAIEVLRKAGAAKADKKSGRATNQGKLGTMVAGNKAAMVEVLCETDFAANTDQFKDLVTKVCEATLAVDGEGDVTEAVNAACKELLTSKIATIGENMQIRRAMKLEGTGVFDSYLHTASRIGVLVEVEGDNDADFIHNVCIHIAAFTPRYICSKCVPADVIEHEKEIAKAQLAGKPENIIEKIVMGKINKWFTEVCLVDQPWIDDGKTCIAKLKPNMTVKRFVRWEIGEEL
ncbi:MAG: elongation factor Ts [Lentisphaeria bacterium]|nr:elongation factor Ts [Lentisphaeria bacterium]